GGGAQAAVGDLVARSLEFGPRGAGLSQRRGIRRLLRIAGGTADQLFPGQLRVALAVGAGTPQLALGGSEARPRGAFLQCQVAGIEFGQQLAGPDPVADIDQAAYQLAADAERERAFLAGADLAG